MSLVGDFVAVFQLAENARQRFKNAPQQYKSISTDLKSLLLIITNFRIHDLTEQQTTSLKVILTGCCDVLGTLEQELLQYEYFDTPSESVRDKLHKAISKPKWNQTRIERFRTQIGTKVDLLNAFTLSHISKISSTTNTALTAFSLHQDHQQKEQQHRDIIDWFTAVDYSAQHNDFTSRRQIGTGHHFLDSYEFKTWFSSGKQTIFCPGIPGAGKTMMTCIVVDDLLTKFSAHGDVVVAYVYCNYRQHQEQKSEDFLLSILKQLLQRRPQIPEEAKELYHRHQAKGSRPSCDEIRKLVHSIAELFPRVFIIIDALDECHSSDEGRWKIVSEILELGSKTSANIFATSRPVPDIVSWFQYSLKKEISASEDDVLKYIDGRMPNLLRRRIWKHPELQQNIRCTILAAVDGMFLLAKLHMDSLSSKLTPGDINVALQALRELPPGTKGLTALYGQAMKRINSQEEDCRALAHKVLSWVTHAKRPLTVVELQHALAVRPGTTELDEGFIPEVEDLLSVCAGLTTTDVQSGTIRWIHYTTQEYFERTWETWLPDSQMEIGKTCIVYISFDTFASGFSPSFEDFVSRVRKYPLYCYAAKYWGGYIRAARCKSITDSSVKCHHLVSDFLNDEAKVSASNQARKSGIHNNEHSFPNYSRQVTGLHLGALFGLVEDVQALLLSAQDPDPRDIDGLTPLCWAAKKGHETIVKALVETKKVNINARTNSRGMTPLSLAAGKGRQAVVETLLGVDGIDVDVADSDGQTPLSRAAQRGHGPTVRLLLLSALVDVESEDNGGMTPLSHAVNGGHMGTIKILLDQGKATVIPRHVWHAARAYQKEAMVKLLLGSDNISVDWMGNQGQSLLHKAVWSWKKEVVKLLVNSGKIDINVKDDSGTSVLHIAALEGDEAIATILLDSDNIDVNCKNKCGWTPLSLATWHGHEAIVRLLLDITKVDVDSEDEELQRALAFAIQRGHEPVVRLLLNTGKFDIALEIGKFGISLARAIEEGHNAVVQVLLGTGKFGSFLKSRELVRALRKAIQKGRDATVQTLLDTGKVDLDYEHEMLQETLRKATENGHEAVVNLVQSRI